MKFISMFGLVVANVLHEALQPLQYTTLVLLFFHVRFLKVVWDKDWIVLFLVCRFRLITIQGAGLVL